MEPQSELQTFLDFSGEQAATPLDAGVIAPIETKAVAQITPVPTPSVIVGGQDVMAPVRAGDKNREALSTQQAQVLDAEKQVATQEGYINRQESERLAAIKQREQIDLNRLGETFEPKIKKLEADKIAAKDQMLRLTKQASETRVYSWWAEAPTGAKVLGLISQALGGAANFLAGNPSAPTPLDRIIEQDLNLQVKNAQLAQNAAEQGRGIYKDLLNELGDERLAYSAAKKSIYESVVKRIETMASEMGIPKASLAENKAIVAINQKAVNAGLEAQKVAETHAYAVSGLLSTVGSAREAAKAARDTKLAEYGMAQGQKEREGAIPGLRRTDASVAPMSQSDASKANKAYAAGVELTALSNQLIELSKNKKRTPEQDARLNSIVERATVVYKNLAELGALTGGDVSIIQKQGIFGTRGYLGALADMGAAKGTERTDENRIAQLQQLQRTIPASLNQIAPGYEVDTDRFNNDASRFGSNVSAPQERPVQ